MTNSFLQLINKPLSEKDIFHLSKMCFNLAFEVACKKYTLLYPHRSIDQVRLEIEDVAYQSIINLFVKKDDTYGISSVIRDNKKEIQSDTDLLYLLTRIITKLVDQTIISMLKERDPFFEKILHTLNSCISKNAYKKLTWFGAKYVVEDTVTEIYHPVITEDELHILPTRIFIKKQTALLRDIFDYIQNHTHFFPAIPYNALIKRLKQVYLDTSEPVEQSYVSGKLGDMHIDEVITFSLEAIYQSIKKTYEENEKLSGTEISNLMEGFKDVCRDLKDGGLSSPLFDYLYPYFPSLSASNFDDAYGRIAYYIYGQLKQEIIKHLQFDKE